MEFQRGSGGPGAAIIEERARLEEENARLEQKVIRLERRVGHLLEALEIQKAMGGGGADLAERDRLKERVRELERENARLLRIIRRRDAEEHEGQGPTPGRGEVKQVCALEEWTHALYRHLVKSQGRSAWVDLPTPPGWRPGQDVFEEEG